MSPRRRSRRPPEVQAALDALKREMSLKAGPGGPMPRGPGRSSGPPGRWGENGPMVSRLLDLADDHVAGRRRMDPPGPGGAPPPP